MKHQDLEAPRRPVFECIAKDRDRARPGQCGKGGSHNQGQPDKALHESYSFEPGNGPGWINPNFIIHPGLSLIDRDRFFMVAVEPYNFSPATRACIPSTCRQ